MAKQKTRILGVSEMHNTRCKDQFIELETTKMALNQLRDSMAKRPFGFCSVCQWNPCDCNNHGRKRLRP